jgi:DNA polymerase delta subunit 2
VIAVLGAETSSGDFEVKDICYPGAAPQTPLHHKTANGSMDVDDCNEWIAFVSGLSIGPPTASSDLRINMLIEYLLAETGSSNEQQNASAISRLVIVGNSFAPINYEEVEDPLDPIVTVPGEVGTITSKKATKKYGYEANDFISHPTQALAAHFSELSRSLVVHLIPGASDPAGATLPQQPLPRAMFGTAKNYESFHVETNPCWIGAGDCQ